jgi:hypothetical protein
VGDQLPVGNFYNGGSGPNYGIYFGGNALGIISIEDGGSGNFSNEPSHPTVMFFLTGPATTMNVPAGFTTGFSFKYASVNPCTFNVYDGLDGTGTLLATLTAPANIPTGNGCSVYPHYYCQWDPIGVPFSGTAKSVSFEGAANYCGFDDVTFGSITPGPVQNAIPTLSQWGLIILGFVMLLFGTIFILRWRGTSA